MDIEWAKLSDKEALSETGFLVLLKSGHGVKAGMFRKPERVYNQFYYRLYRPDIRTYRRPVQELLDEKFGADTITVDEEWFNRVCGIIEVNNLAIKLMTTRQVKKFRKQIEQAIAPYPELYEDREVDFGLGF